MAPVPSRHAGLASVRQSWGNVRQAVAATPVLQNLVQFGAGLSDIAHTAKANKEGYEDLALYAGRIISAVGDVINSSKGSQPDNLAKKMTELQTTLKDIHAAAEERAQRAITASYAKANDDVIFINRCKERLTESLNLFGLEASFSVHLSLKDVQVGMKRIEDRLMRQASLSDQAKAEAVEREERQLLRECLPHAEAGFDPNKQCLPGTRVAILNKILLWAQATNNTSNVLWLSGGAGCGKTTIAHTIASQLKKDRNLASCFFFKHDTAGLNSPYRVFTTLASDLAKNYVALRPLIVDALKDDMHLGQSALGTQFEDLILKPIATLLSAPISSTLSPMCVVWDGLDEGRDAEYWRMFLTILTSGLSTLSNVLRFVITSRPLPDINTLMTNVKAEQVQLNTSTEETTEDLSLYFRTHLAVIAEEYGLEGAWPEIKETAALVKRASGLFVWAVTAVRFIENSVDPEEQLQLLLSNGSVPEAELELDNLYRFILSSIHQHGFPKAFQEVMGAM